MVNEHVVALNVSVYNTLAVHIEVHNGNVVRYHEPLLPGEINLLLAKVQHVVERALTHVLENDVDIRNFGNDAHEHRDVRVSQPVRNRCHGSCGKQSVCQIAGRT